MTHPKTIGTDSAFPMGPDDDQGISIREHFASMAMQGLCTNPHFTDGIKLAEAAVLLADTLIAELNKG